MEKTPRFCSTQSQLVGSELFSYWPMRIQLTPASNIRVHHQRSQGRNGSRGRSELMPNPFSICDERLGGIRSGIWALKGIARNNTVHFMAEIPIVRAYSRRIRRRAGGLRSP